MKPSSQRVCLHPLGNSAASLLAVAIALCGGQGASGANVTWTGAGTGNYNDTTKWTGGALPASGDTAIADTAYNITFQAGDSATLAALNLNITSGSGIFNQTGGSMNLTSLNFGGGGASRSPTYNLRGGTFNTTNFVWGNGANSIFSVSGGTANVTGTTLSMGIASGAKSSIVMTGGIFNANSVAQINVGNAAGGNGQGVINLSGDAAFNANIATLVIGQFGAATSSATNTTGTLTMAGTSTLNAVNVVVGGNNAGSAVNGIVNLNGGTLSTGSIRRGNSNLTASATQLVLNANGGTIKATTHANNSNFLQGLYVNLASGGLKFNTNGNAVGISNAMSGSGGLTKQGAGKLTLSGVNTYVGTTTVEQGELSLAAGAEIAEAVSVNVDGTLSGFGTIKGSTTIEGIHSVGASPGLQTFTAGLEYTATGILNWELIADSTADRGLATGYDAINVTGGSIIVDSDATINLVLNSAGSSTDFTDIFWASNQNWLVIDGNTGSSSTFKIGTAPVLDANGVDSASYGTFTMTTSGNGDHVLQWTAVPEPSAALLGSLGLLALFRRRSPVRTGA